MRAEQLARSLVGAVVVGLDTATVAPTAIATAALLGPTHPWVNRLYREFARIALAGCSARLRTTGDDHLDPDARYVFVANHLSDLDPLAIICALRNHPVRFVAKEELARLPLFGPALRATGNVIVTRSDTQGDVAKLEAAQQALLREISVLFFAEGTRSRSGELGAFKRGAAVFALRAGMPLVPVGVHGTFEILPRGLEIKRGGEVGVAIGEPIGVAGRSLEERVALTEELRRAVIQQIERARELV